jgi:hypothetical protein
MIDNSTKVVKLAIEGKEGEKGRMGEGVKRREEEWENW